MHLDCSCALVRPLDDQPQHSPSAGILYYPELLRGFHYLKTPVGSLRVVEGEKPPESGWAPRTIFHLSTMQNPPITFILQ